MNKTSDGSGTLILVRCITHMRQILLQVFVHLFHNFILIDNKIDKNLKLRLYGGRRYQMLILWLEHALNDLFSIKLYKNENRMKSLE